MLKPLTREFPIAIVVVTHTRKMGATDAMDKISGTQGLVGGVDNYMILSRASGNMDAELVVNGRDIREPLRSEEHTSELQSLMRISYAVFCLKKKIKQTRNSQITQH